MKPQGIPEKLKIGGLIYEVLLVEDRNFEHAKTNTGSCNSAYQKIWLEYGKRKIDGLKDDLLHEIVEAIIRHADIEINHQTITTLASMLNQVLRDNRLIFFEDEEEGGVPCQKPQEEERR